MADKSIFEHLLAPGKHPGRPLLEAEVHPNPFVQFAKWHEDARQAGVLMLDVMALATASSNGEPSVRFVLLRGFSTEVFVFFTNYKSRKGEELKDNPSASLAFYWYEFFRQVRIDGRVEKVSAQESDEDFANRPVEGQLAIWALRQGEIIDSREVLERRVHQAKTRLGNRVSRPAHWGGFRLIPSVFEFWQGHPDMLHDRIAYRLGQDGKWLIERLAP